MLNLTFCVILVHANRLDRGRCRNIAIRKKAARKSHHVVDHGHVRGQNHENRDGDIAEAGAEAGDANRKNDEVVHDHIRVDRRDDAIRPAIEVNTEFACGRNLFT